MFFPLQNQMRRKNVTATDLTLLIPLSALVERGIEGERFIYLLLFTFHLKTIIFFACLRKTKVIFLPLRIL